MKTETALSTMPAVRAPAALPEEEEGGLNFGAFLRTLQRKWWLIVGTVATTTALSGARVLTDSSAYTGQFEILVQARSTETEVISDVPNTLTTAQPQERVTGDLIKLLQSPKVLQPVIDGLRDRLPSFCPTTTQSTSNYDTCYGEVNSRLSVGAADKDSQIIQASFQAEDPQIISVVLNLLSDAYLAYSLESKQADIRRGIDFVEQKLPDLRGKVDTLQTELQTLRQNNNIIDPSSRGTQIASQVNSFSQQQLEVQSQLRQLRAIANELQQQTGVPQEEATSSVLNQNPRYQALLNSLLEIDAQIAEASTLYLDNSPDMEVLTEQRRNLVELLTAQSVQSQREVLRQIQDLETQERSIAQTMQGLNANVDELAGISRNYSDIERELQIATNNLNQFLSKREALQIDAAQREVPWQIITPPTPPQNQPESLLQNLLLGAMLGLIVGTGIALLADKSAGIIYGEDDIKRSTRLPILARVPNNRILNGEDVQERFVESLQYVGASIRAEQSAQMNGNAASSLENDRNGTTAVTTYSSDPFSEAFRLLLTNLKLSNGQKVKSVAVSSTTAGEGKSTVAIYLAEAAAAMGQKVLLVDADLRNPSIHQYLELSNKKGLTSLFSGETNPAVIQRFSESPTIYVMCTGDYAIEPSRALASTTMQKLVQRVQPVFDLIIFDTPPLLGQSDAYLVTDLTDGLLLVTQSGKVKQSSLSRAMEQLRTADINVLGVVTRER
ncbi:MAG: GumC family protein [Phormidesmis sp.]